MQHCAGISALLYTYSFSVDYRQTAPLLDDIIVDNYLDRFDVSSVVTEIAVTKDNCKDLYELVRNSVVTL